MNDWAKFCTLPVTRGTVVSLRGVGSVTQLRHLFTAIVALAVGASSLHAQDWSSCSSDLDGLRRASSDAESSANLAESAQRRFDNARHELSKCLASPEVFDLLRDGCKSKRSDLEFAQSSLRSSVSNLQSSLSDVDSRIRLVNSSCRSGVALRPPRQPLGAQKPNPLCEAVSQIRGQLSERDIMETCTRHMSEAECRKCYNAK